jgi:multisubunit Na+/H+ antiporter MnhE subunit
MWYAMTSVPRAIVAVVAADSPTLEATLARVDDRIEGDRRDESPPGVTVFCPTTAVSNRVAEILEKHDWTATVSVVEEFSLDRLAAAIEATGPEYVVVDPAVPFSSEALRSRVADVLVDVSVDVVSGNGGPASPAADPSGLPPGRRRLRQPTGWPQRLVIFGLAFGFYLLLGQVTAFEIVTGVVSALVVVLLLSHVTFTGTPSLRRTVPRVGRTLLYLPSLLWEIVAANVALTIVLLDPRLPIDPSIETIDVDAESDLELAVLANSITLTPGTVTVDVRDSTLVVHTLTEASRESLQEGSLRRAVRTVFHGRESGAEAAGEPRTVGKSGDGGPGPETGGDPEE